MTKLTNPLKLTIVEQLHPRKELVRAPSEYIFPWRRPCGVNVVLVTDGGLDCGVGDFGLFR